PVTSDTQPPQRQPTGSPAAPLRVVIIEDLREVRDGLATLINGTNGHACLSRHRTMEDALARLDHAPPDVILTDLGLPGMSGIDGIRLLRARFANVPILALTIYDNADNVFAALCPGAS